MSWNWTCVMRRTESTLYTCVTSSGKFHIPLFPSSNRLQPPTRSHVNRAIPEWCEFSPKPPIIIFPAVCHAQCSRSDQFDLSTLFFRLGTSWSPPFCHLIAEICRLAERSIYSYLFHLCGTNSSPTIIWTILLIQQVVASRYLSTGLCLKTPGVS